jgi:hypothetical protein
VKSFGQSQDWLHVLHGASDPSLKYGSLLEKDMFIDGLKQANERNHRECARPNELHNFVFLHKWL